MVESSRRAIVGAIAISIAFVMELTLVPLLLPAIQAEFGLTISEVAWVFNSYGVAVAVGVLIGGWLGDLFGVRKVFAAGVVLFATGAALVAIAGSFETILPGRVLQGLGGGIFSPLVPVLLTRASPDRPGRVLVIWGSVTGYVAAFAPLLFSRAFNELGWQLAFGSFAVVALVAWAITGRSHPAGPEHKGRTSLDYARVLQSRELWVIFVYVFCTYGSITYYLFRVPLWLADNGSDVTRIGVILFSMWFSFSVLSTLLRNLVDSPRLRSIMLAAPALIISGFLTATLSESVVPLVASAILVGAGLACSNAPSTQMVLRFAPKGMSAISTSLDITFARLGGVATVSLLAQTQFDQSILAVAFLSAVALFCARACAGKEGVTG
ncbi:MAG: MFS transporter [Pseudomonadota bacterium]